MPRVRAVGLWTLRAVLGVFILWQLVFLLGLNFCEVSRHYFGFLAAPSDESPKSTEEDSAARESLAHFQKVFTRWAEFTGQTQSWSLFAPGVWSNIPFVAVEFRWDDEEAKIAAAPRPPVYLLSDNEPRDTRQYVKLGLFRLRRYESNLDVNLYHEDDKPSEEMTDKWRLSIFQRVRGEAPAMRAYLEWRWRTYQAAHPDVETPKQVILHIRVYRIPPPPGPRPWTWSGPEDRPMARWRPHFLYVPGTPGLETYDLVAERYDVLQ